MKSFLYRRKVLRNTSALELIPIRIHEHEMNKEGIVTILVPKFKSARLTRLLIPKHKSKFIKIDLDEIGSAVWLSIDGIKSTSKISETLTNVYGKEIHSVDERVVKFLTGLFYNKHITFKQLEA